MYDGSHYSAFRYTVTIFTRLSACSGRGLNNIYPQ